MLYLQLSEFDFRENEFRNSCNSYFLICSTKCYEMQPTGANMIYSDAELGSKYKKQRRDIYR